MAPPFPNSSPSLNSSTMRQTLSTINGDDGTWRTLLMKEGVSWGCPLSPLFASFAFVGVAQLLEPMDSLLCEQAAARLDSGDPGDDGFDCISHLLGYAKDISSCIYLPDLPFLDDLMIMLTARDGGRTTMLGRQRRTRRGCPRGVIIGHGQPGVGGGVGGTRRHHADSEEWGDDDDGAAAIAARRMGTRNSNVHSSRINELLHGISLVC